MALSSTSNVSTGSTSVLLQPEQIKKEFNASSLRQLFADPGAVTITNIVSELVRHEYCDITTKHHVYKVSTANDGTISIKRTDKSLPMGQALWRLIRRILPQGYRDIWKNALEGHLNREMPGIKARIIGNAIHRANLEEITMAGKYSLILHRAYKEKEEKKLEIDEAEKKWPLMEGKLLELSRCVIASMKATGNIKDLENLNTARVSLNEQLPSVLQSFVAGEFDVAFTTFSQTVNEHGQVLKSIPGVRGVLENLEKQLADASTPPAPLVQ